MRALQHLVFDVFPAYAGVIPSLSALALVAVSFSRIRGGDPKSLFSIVVPFSVFPAYAGVIPWCCPQLSLILLFFPHTRG